MIQKRPWGAIYGPETAMRVPVLKSMVRKRPWGASFGIYGQEKWGTFGVFWGASGPKTLPAQAENEPFCGTGKLLISGKPALEVTVVLFPQPQAMSHI